MLSDVNFKFREGKTFVEMLINRETKTSLLIQCLTHNLLL